MSELRTAAEMALGALETLWDILDDIDTASDMAKENDAWYRKRVEALQKKRWDTMITTDGYNLKGGPVEALRQALAQSEQTVSMTEYKRLQDLVTSQGIRLMEYESSHPKQEPFCYHDGRNIVGKEFADHSDVFPLYTTPRQWQGLTDEEIEMACWARVDKDLNVTHLDMDLCRNGEQNEYTALAIAIWDAAKKDWQGLTDEEIDELALDENGLPNSHIEFARAIEAKLKEKNT